MLTISQLLRYTLAADRHAAQLVHVHAWRGFRKRDGAHGVQIITITRERGASSRRHQLEIETALKSWRGKISDRGCPVLVSCNCGRFCFYYEWVLHQHGAARIRYCNGEPPYINNPTFRLSVCIAAGTLIPSQRGLLPIEEIKPGDLVYTLNGFKKVTAAGFTGVRHIKKIILRSGKELLATADHQVKVVRNNRVLWSLVKDITLDDYIVTLSGGAQNDLHVMLPSINLKSGSNAGISLAKAPSFLSGDLARLLGYMVAEGWKTSFPNTNKDLIKDFVQKTYKVFGIKLTCTDDIAYIPATLCRAFEAYGIKWYSDKKEVPEIVMRAPKKIISEFLRGFYGGDGYITDSVTTSATAASKLMKQLQILLFTLGVYTKLGQQHSGVNNTLMHSIRTSARADSSALASLAVSARGFTSIANKYVTDIATWLSPALSQCVPINLSYFRTKWAENNAKMMINSFSIEPDAEIKLIDVDNIIKYGNGRYHDVLAARLAAKGKLIKKRLRKGGKAHNLALGKDILEVLWPTVLGWCHTSLKFRLPQRHKSVNKKTVLRYLSTHNIAELDPQIYEELSEICRNDVVCDRVVKINDFGIARVHDVSVPDGEHFIANGSVVHNCKHLWISLGYVQHYGL